MNKLDLISLKFIILDVIRKRKSLDWCKAPSLLNQPVD